MRDARRAGTIAASTPAAIATVVSAALSPGGASKDESAMLPNRLTGELREVDVILRLDDSGHQTVIAIEAAARSRRASVDWVEQMIGALVVATEDEQGDKLSIRLRDEAQ